MIDRLPLPLLNRLRPLRRVVVVRGLPLGRWAEGDLPGLSWGNWQLPWRNASSTIAASMFSITTCTGHKGLCTWYILLCTVYKVPRTCYDCTLYSSIHFTPLLTTYVLLCTYVHCLLPVFPPLVHARSYAARLYMLASTSVV